VSSNSTSGKPASASEPTPLPPTTFSEHFDFEKREKELYALWEEEGSFSFDYAKPSANLTPNEQAFVLCMPPPNANGELHLGHAYGYSVMDAMGRFNRAQGRRVLLLPGKDHAGIQTQVVFENKLRAEGKDTSQMSREALFDACYAFCMDRSTYMRVQEKQLGLSADWKREFFTLDPRLTKVIYETFTKLWNDGLIYKGKRIVNWSVLSGTAISDVEVERKEVDGTLTYIRYPFASKPGESRTRNIPLSEGAQIHQGANGVSLVLSANGFAPGDILTLASVTEGEEPKRIVCFESTTVSGAATMKKLTDELSVPDEMGQLKAALEAFLSRGGGAISKCVRFFEVTEGLVTATTRPETMLGDTALAVHPKDPRYAHVVGSQVKVPLIGRMIPIVADERAEMGFGTGVIKVTPAHDFVDFDIGITHKLEVVQVIGTDGLMTSEAGSYAGLEAKKCRAQVVKDLESEGRVLQIEKIKHKVPIAERSKDIIEPLISEQWFIAVDAPGKSLKEKALKLVEAGKIQIHPPHFRKEFEHWLKGLRDWNISRQLWWGHRLPVWYKTAADGKEEIFVGSEAPKGDEWRQETDTFDTWFSSGQWAFSTLAGCGEVDLATGASPRGAFPSQCMTMGRDILFFWACRMLLLTAYRMSEVPWQSIYFTGLIRDEQGNKMSKSKGNGVEPGVMIAKYGADALRLALLFGTTPGNDVNMGETKIAGYSKFINKLWNAGKLLEMRVLGAVTGPLAAPTELKSDAASWIVQEVIKLRKQVRHLMSTYQSGQALTELYGATWDTFCDWYLEIAKILSRDENPELTKELQWAAQYSFGSIVEMLHPFIPYITEELCQKLPGLVAGNSVCGGVWRADYVFTVGKQGVATGAPIAEVIEIVKAIRSSKAVLGNLGSGIPVALTGGALTPEAATLVQELARVKLVKAQEIPAQRSVKKAFSLGVLTFDHPDREGFAQKLKKEAESLKETVQRLEQRLGSDFAARARPDIVQAEREKLATAQKTLQHLTVELEALGG